MTAAVRSEKACAAILAGAQFVVCPTLNIKTVEIYKRYSVPVVPRAFTPTEILTAWDSGTDSVKVFPSILTSRVFFYSSSFSRLI